MIKKHRVYSFLINNAYKELHQASISSACKCTPEYTCKLVKNLIQKKVLVKNYRNSVFVTNPLMLCFILAFEKRKIKPLMYRAPDNKSIISVLNRTVHSLTLDSALKVKNGKELKKVFARVLGRDLHVIESSFDKTKNNPDLVIYPSDSFNFINQELFNDYFLVSEYDLFVDLLQDSRVNAALSFAKEFKIFKTNSYL